MKHDLKRLLDMTFLKNVCGVHFEEIWTTSNKEIK
jgi:hypothetical protein